MGCSDCTPVDVERWRPPFDEGGSLPAVYDSLWRVHRIPRSPPMRRARVSAMGIVESHVEEAMLAWLGELGYEVAYGPDVEPEKLAAERDDFTEVVLSRRLEAALRRINQGLLASAIDDALKKALVTQSPSLVENNHRFHRLLVEGVDVEYTRADGSIAGDKAWLVDFDDPDANDWLAINQFTVVEGKVNKRPDAVSYTHLRAHETRHDLVCRLLLDKK